MTPEAWRIMVEASVEAVLPPPDPHRERWFPAWRSALACASINAYRSRTRWYVRRDPEFGAWIASPRLPR